MKTLLGIIGIICGLLLGASLFGAAPLQRNYWTTNAVPVGELRTNPASTLTAVSCSFDTNGPRYWFWTNMVTNVTVNLTNTWSATRTNRTLDFFFTGATNNGPNYTVTFQTLNPAGVVYRWGIFSLTNGATSFSVTNNGGAGASLTLWNTNLVEGYFSPTH